MTDILGGIVEIWLKQIAAARKAKQRHFGFAAEECWRYYTKKFGELYIARPQDGDDQFPTPTYKCRLNLSREFVSLMLPFVHHRVPHRLASPRNVHLRQRLMALVPESIERQRYAQMIDETVAEMLSGILNYLPSESGLVREARSAIPEGLVKGRAVLYTEMFPGPYGLLPGSFYESIDGTFLDPDCVQPRDAGYIVRERRRSAYRVAEEWGIPVSELRSSYNSQWSAAMEDNPNLGGDDADQAGDVIVYYEVYSRMGIGTAFRESPAEMENLTDALDSLGQHIFLVICPGVKYPLSLAPAQIAGESMSNVKARLSWPIAFYEDYANPWPCTFLDIYPNSDNPWATSPLLGGLPLQKFLDHIYSYLIARVKVTCRDIILVSEGMEEVLKNAIRSGYDQEIVAVPGKAKEALADFYAVMDFPTLNADTWKVLELAQKTFERATGMTPLLYGAEGQTQVRVAADVQAREQHVTNRPQDYADAVEDWMGRVAVKESQAARLMIEPAVFARMVSEPAPEEETDMPVGGWGPLTQTWMELGHTDDPRAAAADFQVTVEAGSGRRKNKAKQVQDTVQLTQTLLAPMLNLAQVNPAPYNALMEMLGESLDRDMTKFMLAPPQMPPPESAQSGETQPTETPQETE